MRTLGAYSMLAVGLVLITGCGVELEGDEGNLSFNYMNTEWRSPPSSGDLAVGAKVDIELTDVRGEPEDRDDDPLELVEAYSDDAQILEVVDESQFHFQLEALDESVAEGAQIRATALDADGDELSDSVSIRTAEVDSVDIDSTCSKALYVTDGAARFHYDMRDAAGSRLTGYGYYPVIVEPEPGGSVVDDHGGLQSLVVDAGAEPGTYEIVPDGVGGDAFEFELLEPAEIDELDVAVGDDDEETTSSIEVGDTEAVAMFVLGRAGDSICGDAASAVQLESLTPEVCEPSYGFVENLHLVDVEGLAEGQCQVELSVVDTELESTISVDVD